MEELLSSYSSKLKKVTRSQQVEGEIIIITDEELILNINTKSDAVLPKKELSHEQLNNLKVGDKLTAFVLITENEEGQIVLGMHLPQPVKSGGRFGRSSFSLTKFIQAQRQNSTLSGQVIEINKGGLIVEVDSTRGFLPNSQIGLTALNMITKEGELLGKEIQVKVIETDEKNNKLVFSQKGLVEAEAIKKLREFKKGDKVKGVVVGSFPFAVAVKIQDVVGLVFSSDVSWGKEADLSKYQKGQEVEVLVLGLDEELGRINLSLKHLTEDPFNKLSEKFQPDDVVKAEILRADESGVTFKLDGGIEGILPTGKIDPAISYEVGKTLTVLIDTIDLKKHKITLAPMVTSTEGLIYK